MKCLRFYVNLINQSVKTHLWSAECLELISTEEIDPLFAFTVHAMPASSVFKIPGHVKC